MVRGLTRAAVLVCLAFTYAIPARAQAPTLTLELSAAAECPGVEAFADLVRARLGYDPFVASSSLRAIIELSGEEGHFEGSLGLARDGVEVGTRRLHASSCEEVAAALAAGLALAVDPLGVGAAAGASTATLVEAPELPPVLQHGSTARSDGALGVAASRRAGEMTESDTAPQSASQSSESLRLWLGAGVVGAVALAPEPTLGGQFGVGLRADLLLLRVRGRFESTIGAVGVNGTAIEVRYLSASLEPCVRWELLIACGSIAAGMVQIEGIAGRLAEAAVVRAGALGGLALELSPVDLELSLELHVPLTHVVVAEGARDVWTTPVIAGALHAAVGVSLP